MHDEPKSKVSAKPKKKKKRGSRTLTIIFYTLYCIIIFSFLAGLYYANSLLEENLAQYEESHITVQTEKAFEEIFRHPDWAALYAEAGIEDTAFEDVDAYVSYMEATVGDKALTYEEIPGSDGVHTYLVKAGDIIIGSFEMSDQRQPGAKWPNWQPEALSLEVPRNVTVKIRKLDDHTVTVNGIPLDDSYTRSIHTLLAEEYTLPGTSGIAMELQEVSGLLLTPEILVLDENGNPCPLVQNPETGIYEEQLPEPATLTPELERIVRNTASAWGAYKLRNASAGHLSLYFNPRESAYRSILAGAFWTDAPGGYTVEAVEIADSQIYSEAHFSAYVTFRAKMTGSETVYAKGATFFFEKNRGSWSCYEIQPGNVYTDVTKVRLAFLMNNVEVYYDFYETDRTGFYAPLVTAPDGAVFVGWGTEDGQILFTPDDTGFISLPQDTALEAMNLHAIFAPIEGGN